MNRRKFIAGAAAGLGAAYFEPPALAGVLDLPVPTGKAGAHDTVVLGKTASAPAGWPWEPARWDQAAVLTRRAAVS